MGKYEELIKKHIEEHGIPLCQCGCGRPVNFKRGKPNKYVLHHASRVITSDIRLKRSRAAKIRARKYGSAKDNYIKRHGMPLCKCGCGKPVDFKFKGGYEAGKFKKFYSNACLLKWYKDASYDERTKRSMPLCKCGCGKPVDLGYPSGQRPRKYLPGHYKRSSIHIAKYSQNAKKYIEEHGIPLCQCGCGRPVNFKRGKPNKYVGGHILLTEKIRYQRSEAAKANWRKNRELLLKASREGLKKVKKFSFKKKSILERAFQDYCCILGIVSEPEYYVDGYPYPFDFYLIEQDILIQLQGEYWHGLENKIKADKKRREFVEKNGLVMVEFKECEFLSRTRIMDEICRLCNIDKIEAVDYDKNKLVVNEIIDKKVVGDFLYAYHYMGPIVATVSFGLFLGDKLLGICSFGGITRNESAARLHVKTSEVRELKRFCLHPTANIKNMASWFMSRALKKFWSCAPTVKKLVTFCDTTFGHSGSIYKAIGWVMDGEVKPTYWYIDSRGNRYHKRTVWHHATKMKANERDYANKAGLYRIDGESMIRFVLERSIT